MKKIGLILLCFLLIGCDSKVNRYKQVSDAVIDILQTNKYSKKGFNKEQTKLLEKYLENNNDKEINIHDFVIYSDIYKTNKQNSDGVYVKNNQCYIKYSDLTFIPPEDRNGEDQAEVICNGYVVTIPKESIDKEENISQEYRFLGYYKDESYHFAYRSYEDGSGLIITISDKIQTEFASVNGLDLQSVTESKNGNKTMIIISAMIIGGCVLFIVKKAKENNDM